MAYSKQTWQSGDTITAAKLNHMEDGIAGAGLETFEVNFSVDVDTLAVSADKTFAQMCEAYNANKNVVGIIAGMRMSVATVITSSDTITKITFTAYSYSTDDLQHINMSMVNVTSEGIELVTGYLDAQGSPD